MNSGRCWALNLPVCRRMSARGGGNAAPPPETVHVYTVDQHIRMWWGAICAGSRFRSSPTETTVGDSWWPEFRAPIGCCTVGPRCSTTSPKGPRRGGESTANKRRPGATARRFSGRKHGPLAAKDDELVVFHGPASFWRCSPSGPRKQDLTDRPWSTLHPAGAHTTGCLVALLLLDGGRYPGNQPKGVEAPGKRAACWRHCVQLGRRAGARAGRKPRPGPTRKCRG